jgi:hypothetical protein
VKVAGKGPFTKANRKNQPAGPHVRWKLPFGLVVLCGFLACGSSDRISPNSPATPEEKAYLSEIEVGGAKMMAARNFLGNRIVTMEAQIANHGQKTVRFVELQLKFMDLYGQKVVLQTNAFPITPDGPPLKPGESRSFSVSFEQVPPEWNQAPPRVKPVRVIF